MTSGSSVFVLSLDGANRQAILKGINNGSLPNMAEVVAEGDIDTLTAPLPPTTPVSMSSILTGVYPDKHEIFSFEKNPEEGGYVGYDDIKSPTIFDILESEDKRIISINTPMTSPPPEINGQIVSGFPVNSSTLAWPPTLNHELKNQDYHVEPVDYNEGQGKFVDGIFDLAGKRYEVAEDLIENEWDAFFLTFTGDARLQHFIDDEDIIMEFYKKIDKYLGDLLEKVNEDVRLMIISDHGFQDLEVEFDIGKWLSNEGYLDVEQDVDWSNLYGKIDNENSESGVVPGGAYLGNLFANKTVKKELVEELEKLEYKGKKVFRDVFLTEELYGETNGPDIIPVPRRGFNYVTGSNEAFNETTDEKRVPDSEGVIISDFELTEDKTPESVDILPTILNIIDVSSSNFDGKTLIDE